MNVWDFILTKYHSHIPVVLLYVLQSEGSSPGRQGFKMAVAADNDFMGTVGGGIMEFKFVEMAKDRLQQKKQEALVLKQIHDKAAPQNQSGMICSGEQTIFLYLVQEADIASIISLVDSLQKHENGTLSLSHTGIRFSSAVPTSNFYFQQSGDDFILQEKTGYRDILHIVGGGHCALALSRIIYDLDFKIHLYDDRPGLNTMDDNRFAHSKTILPSYADIGSKIESGENVYVVIMTFGYRTDDIAVRALLYKKFKYFGILGSKKKMEKMFDQYQKENISEGLLAKIHSPVGIQIRSQTAAEIAISIAAEIISVKNNSQPV